MGSHLGARRARPRASVAGDPAFGEKLLGALAPFVWRRAVDPSVVDEMGAMLGRARAEAGLGVDDDLKIGQGGIREVEFFAQSLQLVWGGREPRVRGANTVEALRRLRARGFVTEREERELSDAYFFLRRLEHRIQFATGQQTHAMPRDPAMVERIARSLGYDGADPLQREVYRVRAGVASRFASLGQADARSSEPALDRLWAALDAQDEAAIAAAAAERFGPAASPDLPRHLLALARPPHSPLGATTRDTNPAFARRLVGALADAADAEQATRLLAAFFARFVTPGAYVRALADDPFRVSAVCSLLGASAFLGESLAAHPDMADLVFFARGLPSAEVARAQLDEEVAALTPEDSRDVDAFVGALRRVKRRVTFEVGMADLAGELGTRESLTCSRRSRTRASIRRAASRCASEGTSRARESRAAARTTRGAGSRWSGWGSSEAGRSATGPISISSSSTRAATTRRPSARLASRSGSCACSRRPTPRAPGTCSMRGFGRPGVRACSSSPSRASPGTRASAPRPGSGRRSSRRASARATGSSARASSPSPARPRTSEARPIPSGCTTCAAGCSGSSAHERLDRSPARYDLKVGRGGIVDIEFAAQWLQMRHGNDPRVRTTETEVALSALETCGHLDASLAEALRDGWRFLRRLEQRVRVSHGTSVNLLEEGAPGLVTLARRMGMRDGPRSRADHTLLERYVAVTTDVRTAYLRVLGLKGDAEPVER